MNKGKKEEYDERVMYKMPILKELNSEDTK
jgi:hypothetical protein